MTLPELNVKQFHDCELCGVCQCQNSCYLFATALYLHSVIVTADFIVKIITEIRQNVNDASGD